MTNPNAETSPAASRDRELFQSLTDAKTPAGALGASVGVHAVLVLCLIVLPLLAPQALHVSYRTMFVAPPPPPEMLSDTLPAETQTNFPFRSTTST